jgi:phosphoesterase RecJ-like protein
VYGDVPPRRYALLRASLETLEQSSDGPVAWMTVPEGLFRELGCTSEDLDGLVDYPRSLEGVDVGLLFREIEPGQVKVSFRSNGGVDVNALARSFGGGGHVRASGALVSGSLDEVRGRVVRRALEAVPDGAAPPAGEPKARRGVTQ